MGDDSFGRIDLFSKENEPTSSANDAFACCSRFRDCSDAGACVISEREYSVNCAYRKELEKGNIFYGKKSIHFSQEQYNKLCESYRNLDSSSQNLLNSILKYFYFSKPASANVIIYKCPELLTIEMSGFISIETSSKVINSAILPKFKVDYLKEVCTDYLKDAKDWIKTRRMAKGQSDFDKKGKKKKDMYREELVEWILMCTPPVSDAICGDLTILSIPSHISFTLGEMFHEYLLPNVPSIPNLTLPAEADPRFLKSTK